MAANEERLRRRQPQPTVEELTKEFIIRRHLRPGDKLPSEHELADELGASRGAVREAVRGLQSLGILEVRHGQGMYLREITLSGLTDSVAFWSRLSERDGLEALYPIAEVREVLETSLVARVVGLHTAGDLHDLDSLVREMWQRAEKGQHSREADRRFHEILFRPLDNWILVYLMRAFWDAQASISREAKPPHHPPEVIARQHEDILDAVKRGDKAAAVAAMIEHFDNALRRKPGDSREE